MQSKDYKITNEDIICLNHQDFLEKLTKHHPKNSKLLNIICHENTVNSEKFAHLILYSMSKIYHSDDIKPLIEAMHEFLSLDDSLKKKRVEWLMGIPQLCHKELYNTFGLFCLERLA